jgi:hypothetical protein
MLAISGGPSPAAFHADRENLAWIGGKNQQKQLIEITTTQAVKGDLHQKSFIIHQ